MNLLVAALVIAIAWVLISTGWLWWRQERVVFQPPPFNPAELADPSRIQFVASDGHALFGYFIEADTAAAPETVVIAFHGNADLAVWFVPWARELARRAGGAVFIPEYRGYSGLAGPPSYASAGVDARAALDYVTTRFPAARIVLYGHSLGTAIASELALGMKAGTPAELVLESPFTSAMDMAARMLVPPVPWLWHLISRVPYDTRSVVSRLDCPVWVAHGTADLVIPASMGRQVFASAKHPAALLIVDGAGHNDVAEIGGERYWSWLTAAVAGRTTQRA
jgi:fermentation-respiration switch protein FrsA (DUF1100 family)